MSTCYRRLFTLALVLVFALVAAPALAEKKFLESDDAKEKDEPQKFLPDYDKLTKGKDADWVYFPEGALSKYKTVSIKEFDHTGHGVDSRDAARYGTSQRARRRTTPWKTAWRTAPRRSPKDAKSLPPRDFSARRALGSGWPVCCISHPRVSVEPVSEE